MNLQEKALEVLEKTSRTFYIPIRRLPDRLQQAVASAYLCMRAIDEIEDHPDIDNITKAKLLRYISLKLQAATDTPDINNFYGGIELSLENGKNNPTPISRLPEVSIRVGEWAALAPQSIAPRIWDATAAMADRMAYWAEINWLIKTESDLDSYTFSVAGAVGLLLSDLWAWYDDTQTNRLHAIGFGRGLQAVNILRNSGDDLSRGVSFFPDGWRRDDMTDYARRNLKLADYYTQSLSAGPALDFCQIPLTLAHATLEVLALGKAKLSRSDVMALVEKVSK